jgi:hypothetical protein
MIDSWWYHTNYASCVLLCRYLSEMEMVQTRTHLSQINAEIERIAPLTPDADSVLEWPPGRCWLFNIMSSYYAKRDFEVTSSLNLTDDVSFFF